MRLCRKFNPFSWTRKTIVIIFCAFFTLTLPSYILGFSAFASSVNPINASLRIPSIGLSSSVSPAVYKNNMLEVPNVRIASIENHNKLFLYAHNFSAFKNLQNLKIGDIITYQKASAPSSIYRVTQLQTIKTSEINMNSLLKSTENPSLILMTCAGEKLQDDYESRLIVYASL